MESHDCRRGSSKRLRCMVPVLHPFQSVLSVAQCSHRQLHHLLLGLQDRGTHHTDRQREPARDEGTRRCHLGIGQRHLQGTWFLVHPPNYQLDTTCTHCHQNQHQRSELQHCQCSHPAALAHPPGRRARTLRPLWNSWHNGTFQCTSRRLQETTRGTLHCHCGRCHQQFLRSPFPGRDRHSESKDAKRHH